MALLGKHSDSGAGASLTPGCESECPGSSCFTGKIENAAQCVGPTRVQEVPPYIWASLLCTYLF